VLIFVFILGVIMVLISLKKFGKITNPFVLELQSIALMIIIPQLIWIIVDEKAKLYLFSDLAILVYVVFLYIGTSVSIRSPRIREIRQVTAVNVSNWFLFGVFLIPLVPIFLTFEFSIAGIRNFYEFVVFSRYASFFELSKFVLYLIIFYRLIKNKRVTKGTLILIPFLFLYGSKMALLDFFIALVVFMEYFRSVSYRKVIVVSVACALLLVMYRFYQSGGDTNVWFTALSYFDQYKNQSFLIKELREGRAEYYYGEIYWSSYLKFIPRFIWADKPKDFGFAIINWDFLPNEAKAGYMPAFGLGSLFADFGYYGVALGAFVAGFIRRFLYNVFVKSKNNISFLMYAFPLTIISTIFLLINLSVDYIVEINKRKIQADDDHITKDDPVAG
jgi:hypothetical protein